MVTHDPDHAFFCADSVLTMKDGRVLEHGPPRRVIREDSMRAIYRTPVRISDVDVGGGNRVRLRSDPQPQARGVPGVRGCNEGSQ